jgi:antirestriction protein ArdC
MRNIHQEVTDQIINELKSGVRPWVKPWSQTPGLNIAANAVTGRPYSGVNTLLLWIAQRHDWSQPRFLTFRQALEAGGHVRKGEHGQHVVFVKDLHVREAEEENPRVVRMLRTYTVFNITQCDELPDKLTAPPKAPNREQRNVLIDEFIAATGAKIWEHDTDNEACYCGGTLDLINMPAFKFFRGRAEYSATLFHELIHWTGHHLGSIGNKQGASSGFKYGRATGAIEAVIACCGIPMTVVEPSLWKKHHRLRGDDKEGGRQLALMLFPAAHALLARKRDHGRAEAALIALTHKETGAAS